jgi:hypothetical protein
MFGYCLRSGDNNFLKDWELSGVKIRNEKDFWRRTLLNKQENHSGLIGKNAEENFLIQTEEFFETFEVWPKENSDGKEDFCLNAIEIFGILNKIE